MSGSIATTWPTRPSAPRGPDDPVERLGPYVDWVRAEIANSPRSPQRESRCHTLALGRKEQRARQFSRAPVERRQSSQPEPRGATGSFDTLRMPVVAGRTLERRHMDPNAKRSSSTWRSLSGTTQSLQSCSGAASGSIRKSSNQDQILGDCRQQPIQPPAGRSESDDLISPTGLWAPCTSPSARRWTRPASAKPSGRPLPLFDPAVPLSMELQMVRTA